MGKVIKLHKGARARLTDFVKSVNKEYPLLCDYDKIIYRNNLIAKFRNVIIEETVNFEPDIKLDYHIEIFHDDRPIYNITFDVKDNFDNDVFFEEIEYVR